MTIRESFEDRFNIIFTDTYPVRVFRQKAAIVIFPLNDEKWTSYEKER